VKHEVIHVVRTWSEEREGKMEERGGGGGPAGGRIHNRD